jgi:N,N'-diacetyllegionaminate synthase
MHEALLSRCRERGVEFMSTPFDAESAEYLVRLGVRRLKAPSGEITNRPYLEAMASHGLPLIVSTGMADIGEVHEALAWIAAARKAAGLKGAGDVTLLHCTSNYPADPQDANLLAIKTLAEATGRPMGYSDHSMGIAIATAAAALGAVTIEKHFTLDRSLPGPDHKASLEPDELKAMVAAIRTVEQALGDGVKAPKPSELPVRDVARRSVTLRSDAPAGHILARGDLAILRPGTGIAPKDIDHVTGRKIARAMRAGSILHWDDLA